MTINGDGGIEGLKAEYARRRAGARSGPPPQELADWQSEAMSGLSGRYEGGLAGGAPVAIEAGLALERAMENKPIAETVWNGRRYIAYGDRIYSELVGPTLPAQFDGYELNSVESIDSLVFGVCRHAGTIHRAICDLADSAPVEAALHRVSTQLSVECALRSKDRSFTLPRHLLLRYAEELKWARKPPVEDWSGEIKTQRPWIDGCFGGDVGSYGMTQNGPANLTDPASPRFISQPVEPTPLTEEILERALTLTYHGTDQWDRPISESIRIIHPQGTEAKRYREMAQEDHGHFGHEPLDARIAACKPGPMEPRLPKARFRKWWRGDK